MTFAEKLLFLRKQNGLSQEQIAEKLNVSRQAVSRWEVGAIPDMENVVKISNYFDCSLDYLMNDSIEKLSEKAPAIPYTPYCLQYKPSMPDQAYTRPMRKSYSYRCVVYHLEWCVHNSKHFGVPQQRRRLYIVGYLDPRCAGQIFPLACGNAQDLKQIIAGPQGQRVYEPDGIACTQCAGSGGWGGKTGLYFIDMNPDPVITDHARCITARQDSGSNNHRGEHSGVMVAEDKPRAVLTPDRETVRQQGRRVKEPDEPMFTITAQDRHGVWHKGRIRKLMPIECWRLQGFTDEQFHRAEATGLKDGHLYKMAGNAVSVPVISAIGRKILALNEQYQIIKGSDDR